MAAGTAPAELVSPLDLGQVRHAHEVWPVLHLLEDPHALVVVLVANWDLRVVLLFYDAARVDLLDDVKALFENHVAKLNYLFEAGTAWYAIIRYLCLVCFAVQCGVLEIEVPKMSTPFIQNQL